VNIESGTKSTVDQHTIELMTFNEQPQSRIAKGKQAGPSIRTLGQFSDSIVENINVWLNVYDTKLNIMLWNKVAEEISGYSREEVVGHSKIWDWSYPDEEYRNAIIAKSATLVEKDETLEYFETKMRCKTGETKIMLWNSQSLVDEKGTVHGAVTFGYDITDRKRAEEALQKAYNEISTLYNVASVTSASLDLSTILERSLDRILATVKSDKGVIHLWDEGEKTLRLAAQQGIPPDIIAQIDPVTPGCGPVGRVFEYGKPLMIPSTASDPRASQTIYANSLHAYIGVPMRAKGKALGVFSVFGEAGHQFHVEDMTLLASIADQVGGAVEHTRLHQQSEQLAVMEERERLARDLHDSVTQSLYSLTLFAEAGRRSIKTGDLERAASFLARLADTAQDALKEMRLLVYELRPPALEREGLVGAIQQRLGAVERRAGVKAHLLVDDMVRLPASVEEELYRIAQEALNNALKHATATSVTVRICTVNERVELEIVDDGIGFDPATTGNGGGMGLANMRKRVEKLGGTIQVASALGQGTKVSVKVKICQGSQELVRNL
jgi:PAS domain S-box-containing protein